MPSLFLISFLLSLVFFSFVFFVPRRSRTPSWFIFLKYAYIVEFKFVLDIGGEWF
jgi:hypothetical protein